MISEPVLRVADVKQTAAFPVVDQNRDVLMQLLFELIWNQSRGRLLAAMRKLEARQ